MYDVIWFHGGQIGTIKATVSDRAEAETLYALMLAHYGPKCEIEMWQGQELIRKQSYRSFV